MCLPIYCNKLTTYPPRYTLWYRTACPAPPQALLSLPPCTVGPRSLIVANFSSFVFVFSGSGLAHPLPYTAYQFIVGAVNSVGSVESAYSTAVSTQTSRKWMISISAVIVIQSHFYGSQLVYLYLSFSAHLMDCVCAVLIEL